MTKPLAYGIDFGTSNSAIAAAYEDRVQVLPIDPRASAPESLASILYLDRFGQRSAGQDAVAQFLTVGSQQTRCGSCELVDVADGTAYTDCRTHARGGFCMNARLMTGLKAELTDKDLATHSWAVDFSMASLVAVILNTMKRRADQMLSADVRRLVLGHPVAFPGAEGPEFGTLQRHAEETLVEAARTAGFEDVLLYPEPSAAVIDESLREGIAVAVDFGGGTFDVAIIEFRPDGGTVTALGGAAIGGELFDAMLFDLKVAPALGLDGSNGSTGLPGWFRNGLRTLGGTARLLSDRSTAPAFRDAQDRKGRVDIEAIRAILFGGQAYALHKAIEAAKIDLSTSDASRIQLQRPGLNLDVRVTEKELADLLSRDMDVVESCIRGTLKDAGITPEQVDLVVRTGGSSQLACFRRRLESIFGEEKISERHLFNTVVSGLGSEARRMWS